ncbi:hypothetical protein JCM19239_434 [Vibrio variabilis]|uniref:Uncharacterized protein n=1 Tax=Vibrio variabilis TaxID=990271 RepID=A0ABQ0JJ97_9VIBR|nr:hypothetical protein JCM19239_434 [Vibrio variabilis]
MWVGVLLILLQGLSIQMLTAINGDVAFLLSMARNTGLQGFYAESTK